MRVTVANTVIAICIAVVFASTAGGAETICPPPAKLPPDADDLRMSESDFEFDEAMSAFPYLEKGLYQVIEEHDQIRDQVPFSVLATEQFYISYPNSIRKVKGALLRQRALLAGEQLRNATGGSRDELETAYEEALEAFCSYLAETEYVD